MSHEKFQQCIEACNNCAVICDHCTMSCLSEKNVQHLTRCIELNLDCASACRVAVEFMSKGSEYADRYCQLCADICNACAEECEKHADMEHCRHCAEVCRQCAEACMEMA
jgi:hypothetical protein